MALIPRGQLLKTVEHTKTGIGDYKGRHAPAQGCPGGRLVGGMSLDFGEHHTL